MLSNLRIENIAIIENASIDFSEGFNCFTGETGAGKSIVIDSINAVLGEKTSRELIRTGESRACVTAYFTDISEKASEQLRQLGLPEQEDGSLLVSRVIMKDGRNVCRVNGAGVNVSMLKKIGLSLINIHGQSDNQELMNPETHYSFIDALAQTGAMLDEYKALYGKIADIKSQIQSLTLDDEYKARQTDMLLYQIDELKRADIKPGERALLNERRAIISNSRNLVRQLGVAYDTLSGGEDFEGAVALLFSAANALSQAGEFMQEASQLGSAVGDMAYALQDYASEIMSLCESVEFDDRQLDSIEERLDLLYNLSKKYGDTEEKMLEYLDKSEKELHNIAYSSEIIGRLNEEYNETLKLANEKARLISQKRKTAARSFEKAIMNELDFLDMKGTTFLVNFTETRLSENGVDEIEFFISANKGEEPKPLAKIASGGELSRIMLAIKSVLAEKDDTDTLIFDEIDSGVSGRAAGKIAQKLCGVSRHRQVLCITHLPVIAAYSDRHMLISKSVKGEKTYTSVKKLDESGRVKELARIIGGSEDDSAHLISSKQLLEEARRFKTTD